MDNYGHDGQLVVTPRPRPDQEGLHGYLLRSSIANGFATPKYLLDLAGVDINDMRHARLAQSNLGRVFANQAPMLNQLPWLGKGLTASNGKPQHFSRQFRKKLNFAQPRICPHCVAENQTLDFAWDLKVMVACPKHKVWLVDQCPDCGKRVSWFRRGLDICKCGAHLRHRNQSPVPQSVIDLQEVVWAATRSRSTLHLAPSGIPAEALLNLGLENLLDTLYSVMTVFMGTRSTSQISTRTVTELAEILSEWPKNFHAALYRIDPTPGLSVTELSRRFESAYRLLAAPIQRSVSGLEFMGKAFRQYPSYHHSVSASDPGYVELLQSKRRQARNPIAQALPVLTERLPEVQLTIAELASKLSVDTRTAHTWANEGLFGINPIGIYHNGETIYEVSSFLPRRTNDNYLTVRGAAKFLGIPVSILTRLRRDGYYEVRHISRYQASYQQKDLEALRDRVLATAPKHLCETPSDCITLEEFFRMKMHGSENKYKVIRMILEGKVTPLGVLNECISSLVINRADATSLQENLAEQNVVSQNIASKKLGCSPESIRILKGMGELEGHYRGRNLYVTTQSIARFGQQYVPCAVIARRVNSSARYVVAMVRQRGGKLLSCVDSSKQARTTQSFCNRVDTLRIFGFS